MKCDDYRAWFERALREDLPEGWPVVEYQRHLVGCPRCQMLLSLEEVGGAIAAVADAHPPTPEENHLARRVVEHVHRRRQRRSVVRRVGLALVFLLAALGSTRLSPTREPVGPVAEPTADAPAMRAVAEELARALANEEFEFGRVIVPPDRQWFLKFVRKDPSADQYEFAKSVVVSLAERDLDVPLYGISINEEGQVLLRVYVRRPALPAALELRGVPGARFLRSFSVSEDRDGKTREGGEE